MKTFRKIANYINLADRISQFILKRRIKKMSKKSMKNPFFISDGKALGKSYYEPFRLIDLEGENFL